MSSGGRRKKVLVLAYYFAPVGASGTFRTLKFVKYLCRHGWESIVVTVAPEYEPLESVDESLLSEVPPATVVYRTYAWQPNRLFRRRFRGNTATPATEGGPPRQRRQSALRSAIRSIVRSIGRSGWYPFAVWAALKATWKHDVDLIYASGPPFACSLAGLTLKRLTGKPLVSDFRDPWGSNTYHDSPHSLNARLALYLERKTFQASDRIINVSSDLETKAKSRSPAYLADRFVTIPNGFDPEDFPEPHRLPGSSTCSEFRITYTGCFYPGNREPFNFLRALDLLRAQEPELFEDIRADFVGEEQWAVEHREWLSQLNLGDHVMFRPFMSHREAVALLHESDILLMIGSVKAADTGSLPAKLFEYLAVGQPILALVHDGESARFVRNSGVGMVADPERPEDICTALTRLIRLIRSGQFGKQMNEALLRRHDRRHLAAELASVFDAITGQPAHERQSPPR